MNARGRFALRGVVTDIPEVERGRGHIGTYHKRGGGCLDAGVSGALGRDQDGYEFVRDTP